MLEIFRELRGLLHVSHVHIDSWVFRLHYSVTTTCMFAFSLIVSAKQYVGNPIDCIHTKDIPEVKQNQIDHLLVLVFYFRKISWQTKYKYIGSSCYFNSYYEVIFICVLGTALCYLAEAVLISQQEITFMLAILNLTQPTKLQVLTDAVANIANKSRTAICVCRMFWIPTAGFTPPTQSPVPSGSGLDSTWLILVLTKPRIR